jgi:uncharacterized protein
MELKLSTERKDNSSWQGFIDRRLITREKIIALIVAVMFTGFIAFFSLRKFESYVTFHPVRYSPGAAWTAPQGAEDVWLNTSDNVRLHGWYLASRTKPATATVIYFHGNGGNISDVGWIGENLTARGFDVLLFDYRGYGRSEGDVEGENELYKDGDAAYEYVVNERGVRPERLVLYGQSLGTTVAVDLASRRSCGALILESGLSSAADMAAAVFPWLPRRLSSLGKNRFDSVRKLAQVKAPVLITHGDPDPVIPVEQGRKLYEAANEPKKLLIFPGAGHNVHGSVGEQYLNLTAKFIEDVVTRGTGSIPKR